MIVIERSTRAPRVLVVMLLVAIVLRLVFQPVAAFGGLGSSERQAGTAGGEASKATAQSITANVQIIGSLEAFKAAVLAKIDSDVETTARAFWDAYDIQRSRRVADFVLAPLTVIEQAIGVMAFGKSAPDVLAGMERAENLIQVVSLLMGLSQLRQMGERLQTALDGPTYSSLVKETLKEAWASSQPGEYATTVKLYLYGIGGRRSPIGVSLQIGSADGASREVVWGAEAVKRRVSDRIQTLIQELAENPAATGVQADTMRMHVATLTEALKRSRADNVTVAPALVSTTTGAPPDLALGSIGALEQVRREALTQYDNDLRLEQISVLTSAVKAGTQVISLKVGYKTPGGKLLKEVQRDVITPGAVLVNTLTKTYATSARYQVAALPHEMVLSLPGELANTWKVVDEVVAAVRSLLRVAPVTVMAPSRSEGALPERAELQVRQQEPWDMGKVKAHLDATYPGWRLAEVSREDRELCFKTPPKGHPSQVSADFNGDGLADYVLQISSGNDRILIGFLSPTSLTILERNQGWVVPITVSKKGASYYDANTDSTRTLAHDALTLRYCGKGTSTYFYDSGRFVQLHGKVHIDPEEDISPLAGATEAPVPVYAKSNPPDFLTNTAVDPETKVRFSLVKGYECKRDTSASVAVIGEMPKSTDFLDDALVRAILKKGVDYFIAQCPTYWERTAVDLKVYLFNGPVGKPDRNLYGGPDIEGFAVVGAFWSGTRFQKMEFYKNLPLMQLQAEQQRERKEEERRRREAEAAARPARLQEMEALRRSGPKALLALTQALGDKDAEVRARASDALREVATAGFSELGVEAKDAIPALTEASKKGDRAARYALRRIKFPSSPPDSCRDELSQGLGGLLASTRARPCPVEGDEEKKAAADQLNVAFTRKHGIRESVACGALSRNPFAYEGKVVALNVTFQQMIARDRGLFGCGVAVSGIPQGVFSSREVEVVLAGRVLGNTEVKIGPATLQVPHLQYVGVHICKEGDCADFFGPASMR